MQGFMYNEYHIKSLLMREDIDFNKFNKVDLIDFLEVATKDLKAYKTKIENAIELIKEEGCYDKETKQFCDDVNYDQLPKIIQILE